MSISRNVIPVYVVFISPGYYPACTFSIVPAFNAGCFRPLRRVMTRRFWGSFRAIFD